MVLTRTQTDGKATSTGNYMRFMVDKYYTDMIPYASLYLSDIFDIIKNIPFRPDPPDEETLMRPRYTMSMQGWGGDCDDKSIALASWAKLYGGRAWTPAMVEKPDLYKPPKEYDFRFVAVRRPDMDSLHHVFTEIYIKDRWIHADPTYPFNTLGRERERYAEYAII